MDFTVPSPNLMCLTLSPSLCNPGFAAFCTVNGLPNPDFPLCCRCPWRDKRGWDEPDAYALYPFQKKCFCAYSPLPAVVSRQACLAGSWWCQIRLHRHHCSGCRSFPALVPDAPLPATHATSSIKQLAYTVSGFAKFDHPLSGASDHQLIFGP